MDLSLGRLLDLREPETKAGNLPQHRAPSLTPYTGALAVAGLLPKPDFRIQARTTGKLNLCLEPVDDGVLFIATP